MSDYVFDAMKDLRAAIHSNTSNNPLFNPNWKLIAHCPGQNDEESWVWVVLDEQCAGWYIFVGWCDYTGWDCQSWLQSDVLPADTEGYFRSEYAYDLTNENLFRKYTESIVRFIDSQLSKANKVGYKSPSIDYKTPSSEILKIKTLVKARGEGAKRLVRLGEKDYAVFTLKQILTGKNWQEITTDSNLVKVVSDADDSEEDED